jgi:hypothetical protein
MTVVWQWIEDLLRRLLEWFFCTIRRLLLAPNEVSYERRQCIYGGTTAYRIFERQCALRITVRVRLNPDADVTAEEIADLRAIWEPGIEERWSNRFTVTRFGGDCGCISYPVAFDVRFVEAGEHHLVRVKRGPGRSNFLNWHTDDDAGTAAHEFGHMDYNMRLLVDAGMTPMQALMAATRFSASACGVDAVVGTLEPGKYADLLLVDGDPTEEIGAISNVRAVFKAGSLVS